jgi:hypothetical protein
MHANPSASEALRVTETAPPARRDGLYALMLAGLVVAALLLGYRGASPTAGAAAMPPALVAVADDAKPQTAAEVATGFALEEAFAIAGAEVPVDVKSFSFFAYTTDTPAEQEIAQLTERLVEASKAKEYLGICGPNVARNRRNLLAALEANHGQDLSGVIILYLGPETEREAVTKAAERAGAPLRFLVFPAKEPAA